MSLLVETLTVQRGPRKVLDAVSFALSGGEFVGLIGPNGAGKTTLLRAALGLLPATGRSSLTELPAQARAKAAAFVPQNREINWPISVERLVALGRAPLQAGAAADRAAIEQALSALDLTELRARPATELSGGEQARALLARALAQETPLLVADEPTSGLDPAAQLAVMELFQTLAAEGRCVLASLHDLGLAARYCTRLIVLNAGRIVADGRPDQVLTPALLAAVFGISARIDQDADGIILRPLSRLQPAKR